MIYLFQPLHGQGYQFWSGIGSDFGEVTLVAAAVTWWVHSRCHIPGCHKHAKYPFHHYKLCKDHHPQVPSKLTHFHIKELYKQDQLA